MFVGYVHNFRRYVPIRKWSLTSSDCPIARWVVISTVYGVKSQCSETWTGLNTVESPLSPPSSHIPLGGSRRKRSSGHSDSSGYFDSPPVKKKSVTMWRKGKEGGIVENNEILAKLKAAVEEKERFVMIQEAILVGLQGLKKYDVDQKMMKFAEHKKDVQNAIQEMAEKKLRSQKKAQYQKMQVNLKNRYEDYISMLDHQITTVTGIIDRI